MPNDPSKTGSTDRSRVNAQQPWELKYWTEKFRVSEQQLKDAVHAVGAVPEDVKRHLGKK